MLPIIKRRTIAIPHKLALVAAAVCLALSFSVDRASIEERLQARNTPTQQPSEQGAAASSIPASERAGEAENTARKKRLNLLPWFSGLRR